MCFSCLSVLFFHVWEFLYKCVCVCVLTKLLLSSQWVTCCPPQDRVYVRVAIMRHGGSGPGVWACFNTRHRWVAPWACCGGLPSAASSGCPDSKLTRLAVTKMLISAHSLPLCLPCLTLTILPLVHPLGHGTSHGFMGKERYSLFLCCSTL